MPHLFIENVTYPNNMPHGSSMELYGDVYTDKGVIDMVTGRIYNFSTGEDEQSCNLYPYTASLSLAGTVNAMLKFGELKSGNYTYVISAIAENDSVNSGSVVLIEQPFEVY